MTQSDPSKPTPNDEKFKPEHVQDPKDSDGSTGDSEQRPSDTRGKDLPRGSESEAGRRSRSRP